MINRKSKVALLPLTLILGSAWANENSSTSRDLFPQIKLPQVSIETSTLAIASAETTTLFGWGSPGIDAGSEPPITEKAGGIGVETPDQAVDTDKNSASSSENQSALGAEAPVDAMVPVTNETAKTTNDTKTVSANSSPIVGIKKPDDTEAPIVQSADAAPGKNSNN